VLFQLTPQRERTLWAILLFAGAILRFHDLGARALHHDESLHAYYAWFIGAHGTYDYTPMMHGPTQLYLMGWASQWWGSGPAQMRSLAAISGAILPLFALALRRRRDDGPGLPPGAALLGGAFVATCPVLSYYSRFFREDMPFAALTALGFAAGFWWWQGGGRSQWLAATASAATGLLLCIKENALIHWFTLFTFANAVLIIDLVQHFWPRRLVALRRLASGQGALRLLQGINAGGILFILLYLIARQALPAALFTTSPLLLLVLSAGAVWCVGLCVLVRIIPFFGWRKHLLAWRLAVAVGRSWQGLLAGLAIPFLVYATLFSDLFRHPKEPLTIFRETFEYWLAEHKKQRLKGPFHYYLPLLATYQLPSLALVLWGTLAVLLSRRGKAGRLLLASCVACTLCFVAAGVSGAVPYDPEKLDRALHMTSLTHLYLAAMAGACLLAALMHVFHGEGLRGLLAWWTLMAWAIYSYAGEKTPWITTHVALPLHLWAACEAVALWQKRWDPSPFVRPAIMGALVLALAWSGFNAVRACFINRSNPRERLIYNTTAEVFQEAAYYATGLEREARLWQQNEEAQAGETEAPTSPRTIQLAYTGASAWPLAYYFRLSPNAGPAHESLMGVDVIFCDDSWKPSPPEVAADFEWIDVPFRQFWTPQLLPVPRMLGWTDWQPDPDRRKRHGFLLEWRAQGSEPARAIGGSEAWYLALLYWFTREPFFDPETPHGYWGAGETAHTVRMGVRREILDHLPGARDGFERIKAAGARYSERALWTKMN